jgi:hypothetical protein
VLSMSGLKVRRGPGTGSHPPQAAAELRARTWPQIRLSEAFVLGFLNGKKARLSPERVWVPAA